MSTPEKIETAVETQTDTETALETVEAETDTEKTALDEAIGRAREQILSLLQHGQSAVNKGYETVVDRIEKLDVTELPGYDRLSNIEAPKFPSESVSGYVNKAEEWIQTGRDQVTTQVSKINNRARADRDN